MMRKALAFLLAVQMAAALPAGYAAAEQPRLSPWGAPAVSASAITYTVLVQDTANAAPLAGAMVQFCSDTLCVVSPTDAEGTAVFTMEPGSYTAHILKAPDGYDAPAEGLTLTAENPAAAFALRRIGAAQTDSQPLTSLVRAGLQRWTDDPVIGAFLEKCGEKIAEALQAMEQ